MSSSSFEERTLDQLTIEDERSFRHVGLYGDLKEVLAKSGYRFRILPKTSEGRWDRALLLNLTFWGANDGGDVLVEPEIPADVVAHVAWHHLAGRALSGKPGEALSSDALFLGESIASAFDVYLVGRLLGHAPRSTFLESQVGAMAESANATGMEDKDFDAMLEGIAADPDRAFEDLRQLLFDATTTLVAGGVGDAFAALTRFDGHRFAALLHHYELSNWVLYARAYAKSLGPDERVRAVDRELRAAPVALDWLSARWVDTSSP